MPPRRKKFQVPRKTTSSEAPPKQVVTPPPAPPKPNRAASRPLTAEQQAAVDAPLNAPLAIVAGAGSGKTETLTRRVARAVAAGARPSSVLVLTFSNKAARAPIGQRGGAGRADSAGARSSLWRGPNTRVGGNSGAEAKAR